MAKIKLFNSLTNQKEVFTPIKKGRVGIYTCGPTVYGPGHLGHARTYTSFDLLKRVFLFNEYQVNHVLNITDIHDDMIKTAKKMNISIQELADKYIPLFKKDLVSLNILPADIYPRVTDHIKEIIEMVKILVDKGYAYVQEDGSVYFNVNKFEDYGKLSGIKLDETKSGTRVETDKYDKENASDFALWKGYKEGEPYWQSPWGKGRPGWHIECSVMAGKYLGETIDIHAGAMDLKFPHHENEIAQFEAAKGKKFVNYWLHAGLLKVESQKMSKSLGNYLEIRDIKDEGFKPLALRYLFLMTHYRSEMNFTWESLQSAQNALEKMRRKVSHYHQEKKRLISKKSLKYHQKFASLINDNLSIPQALALTWEVIDSKLSGEEKINLILDFDRVLGLKLTSQKKITSLPKRIKKLAEERENLRSKGKWGQADEIRKKIEAAGYEVIDLEIGFQIRPLDEM